MTDADGGRKARHRTVRIGLTGPIGCGKSTVAGWLATRGAVVVDADEVARAVTAPGQPAHDAVLARFGDPVRGADGTLDRAALARIVFAHPAALRDLEAIVHPAVRPAVLAEIAAAEAASVPAVVIEAIKLVEGGLGELCDEVWLVTCDARVQRERLLARGADAEDADRRIEAQRERLLARGADAEDADRRIDAQRGLVERLRPAASRILDTSGPAVDTRSVLATMWDAVVDRPD